MVKLTGDGLLNTSDSNLPSKLAANCGSGMNKYKNKVKAALFRCSLSVSDQVTTSFQLKVCKIQVDGDFNVILQLYNKR